MALAWEAGYVPDENELVDGIIIDEKVTGSRGARGKSATIVP